MLYKCNHTQPVEGAPDLVSLAAGSQHACGLTLEGQAYCWGPNNWWGNGTEEHQICPGPIRCNLTPVAVSGGFTFRSISRAEHNACGVTDDGVYCWGWNYRGLLGTGYWEPDRSALPLRVYDGG